MIETKIGNYKLLIETMHHHKHTNPDRFIGQWRLIPEKCVYEVGAPPLEGLYTISQGEEGLSHVNISIKWKSPKG